MAKRMLRECRKIGCKNLTDSVEGYCKDHAQESYAYDKKRANSNDRGYNSRWRRYRKYFLMQHPVCVRCGRLATVVDHIIPHKGNQDLFWQQSNHQALCKLCHDKKTATEDGGFGNLCKS